MIALLNVLRYIFRDGKYLVEPLLLHNVDAIGVCREEVSGFFQPDKSRHDVVVVYVHDIGAQAVEQCVEPEKGVWVFGSQFPTDDVFLDAGIDCLQKPCVVFSVDDDQSHLFAFGLAVHDVDDHGL